MSHFRLGSGIRLSKPVRASERFLIVIRGSMEVVNNALISVSSIGRQLPQLTVLCCTHNIIRGRALVKQREISCNPFLKLVD